MSAEPLTTRAILNAVARALTDLDATMPTAVMELRTRINGELAEMHESRLLVNAGKRIVVRDVRGE